MCFYVYNILESVNLWYYYLCKQVEKGCCFSALVMLFLLSRDEYNIVYINDRDSRCIRTLHRHLVSLKSPLKVSPGCTLFPVTYLTKNK